MRHVLPALAAIFLFVLSPAVLADDSSATLGAGGIVLTHNKDIRMVTEDLYISPLAVRVRYTFANDSKKDIDTIVAFPLPDIDNYAMAEVPMGTTTGTTPNFVGFKLKVDGQPVTATVDEHAMFHGKDVTAQVRAAGLPVSMADSTFYEKLDKLPAAARTRLLKAGLIEDIGSNNFHAKWLGTTKFWWHQRFPAGKTVTIEHSYQPVSGQSFFSDIELTDAGGNTTMQTYCVDAGTKAAIRRKIADNKAKPRGPDDPSPGLLQTWRTSFVIVTANNWKAPIGRFHLILDKLKPDNVLSLCWGGDLRKTGASTFEATRTNFSPAHDIDFLVLY